MRKHDMERVIVEKLSICMRPAERDALLWLPGDGSAWENDDKALEGDLCGLMRCRVLPFVDASLATLISARDELDGTWRSSLWKATPLGLRVRAMIRRGALAA